MKGTGSRHLVIDASVSLKWALDDEEATAEAAALLNAALDDGRQLIAPSLWLYIAGKCETASNKSQAAHAGAGTRPASGSKSLIDHAYLRRAPG